MKLLICCLVFLFSFIGYIRYLEYSSSFHPDKVLTFTPLDLGLSYEDVFFKTQDGLNLNGWFVPFSEEGDQTLVANVKNTVLFLHGNAGNISGRLEKIRLLHDLGYNVFIFDYRGYGSSQGKPSEEGLYRDAISAYDYLLTREDVDSKKIIGFGSSLGGTVAIDLAGKRNLSHLILDSSFSSAEDMAERMFPWIPSFLIKIKFDSENKIKSLKQPKLFFHSRKDQVVPYDLGVKLFEAAQEPKKFVEIYGGHMDGYTIDPALYVQSIRELVTEK